MQEQRRTKMKQSYEIITLDLADRDITNVHLIEPLKPQSYLNSKPYRVLDVDVTRDYNTLKGYVEDAKKSYEMTGKIKDPFLRRNGKWWIELRDYRNYNDYTIYNLKTKLQSQLGTDNVDCKDLYGDVSVKLINWEFGERQGFSWKLNNFNFKKIKDESDILKDSPEPPKIEF